MLEDETGGPAGLAPTLGPRPALTVERAGTLPSRGRLSLVPRFEEALEPEFYRLSGKVRLVLVAAQQYLATPSP